jgi:hypothetical protein
VLLAEYTEPRRARRLTALGFPVEVKTNGHLSLNSLMLLFTLGSVLFLFVFSVAPSRRPDETPLAMLLRSVMIAAIYCVSLWCAIAPKTHWPSARRAPGGPRPWTAYLACALAAAAGGAVVSLAVKVAYDASLAKGWTRFVESLPWTLMTFAVAYAVAVLADDEPADFAALGLGHRPAWLVEAVAMVAIMVPVALLVYRLLLDTTRAGYVPGLGKVLVITVIVAFSVGALVPSWYRHSPATTAAPRLAAAPAAAAG